MAGKPKTGEIYTRYANRLVKADAMDFDDLLYNTYILFRDFLVDDAVTVHQNGANT